MLTSIVYYSTEEAVNNIGNSDSEAVSLGNEVVQNFSSETSPDPVESLNDFTQSQNVLNENLSVPEEIPDENQKIPDEV